LPGVAPIAMMRAGFVAGDELALLGRTYPREHAGLELVLLPR